MTTFTDRQAFQAGYAVGQDSQGWHIKRRETRGGILSRFVLRRDYRTRKEALADLYSEMTDPDGTLRPEDMQVQHDEITRVILESGQPALGYVQPGLPRNGFGVWASITGGVTGDRGGWVKDNGQVATYATEALAAERAAVLREACTLNGGSTPSGRPIAVRQYRVMRVEEG